MQDSWYSGGAALDNSNDVMTQLFLPKAKLIEVYCFAEFIQLQLF
jgi:hypothetical protein